MNSLPYARYWHSRCMCTGIRSVHSQPEVRYWHSHFVARTRRTQLSSRSSTCPLLMQAIYIVLRIHKSMSAADIGDLLCCCRRVP